MLNICDSDSKGFQEVIERIMVKGVTIEKLECIGHMQKRMGTRLRTLRKIMKESKLKDGKVIRGKID